MEKQEITDFMKVSELKGAALDWAVAKCEGMLAEPWLWGDEQEVLMRYKFSTDWSQAGPIIEREICEIIKCWEPVHWEARAGFEGELGHAVATGPTPLIAAMRCYVTRQLGDTVQIPKELCND